MVDSLRSNLFSIIFLSLFRIYVAYALGYCVCFLVLIVPLVVLSIGVKFILPGSPDHNVYFNDRFSPHIHNKMYFPQAPLAHIGNKSSKEKLQEALLL